MDIAKGKFNKEFKTKTELKKADIEDICVINTSMFDGYTGMLKDAPKDKVFTIVGPNEYNRKWYANFKYSTRNKRWVVS